ncbi:MAG: GNAT family N-acetyltransferase [Pseudomonadota bacterium]
MILRPLNIDRDKDAMHAIYGDPECCTYLLDPATDNVHDTVALLRRYDEGHSSTSWVIAETQDGEAQGRVKMIPRGYDVFEAAIMMRPDAQRRGLGQEALCAALDIAFDDLDARRVYADIDPDNDVSIRLFERVGFQKEGRLRATYETHIGVRDTVLMSLIASDPRPWRASR